MSVLKSKTKISVFLLAILGSFEVAMADGYSKLSADQKASLALCLNGRGSASVNDRKQLLSEAIEELSQNLPKIKDLSEQKLVTQKIAKLRDYKSRSDSDNYFWNYGSTCPRQLDFPTYAFDLSTDEGIADAMNRSLRYQQIATCARGRGGYSISDRRDFLEAAIVILTALTAADIRVPETDLNKLRLMSKKANENIFRVWNAGSTCPY